MKPLLLAVVLGISSVQPSRSALPLAPIAIVIGAGATVGGAAMTFYYLQPTWRCWSELDPDGNVLTNYCSTLARCKADDEHRCAGPNFKSKKKCQNICSPTPGIIDDDADDLDYTLTLQTATDASGSEGWTDVGTLTVGMDSEFPQITTEINASEPQRFFRVRVDLVSDLTKGGKP